MSPAGSSLPNSAWSAPAPATRATSSPPVSRSWESRLRIFTPQVAEQLGVKAEHGVAITDVHSGSPAGLAGLTSGMVITEANRQPVKSVEDFRKALGNRPLDKGLLLLVRSAEGSRFVVIRP